MNFPEAFFKIIKESNCPLYDLGDKFKLSKNALIFPDEKATCPILVGDVMEILVKFAGMEKIPAKSGARDQFNCSGCEGLIRIEYFLTQEAIKQHELNVDSIAGLLKNFSIFQALTEDSVKDLVPFIKLKRFPKEATVIKKGDPGKHLFVIVSGRVEVLDEGIRIASLGKGEVFGEMSLLSGDPIVATVRVLETATVLFLDGRYFEKVLNRHPSVQTYLARSLAKRLARTNMIKFEESASGLVGKLSDMPPKELFNTLNINYKSGILQLQLYRGEAMAVFRDGQLVDARYDDKSGKNAVFAILKENKGRFKFNQGLPTKYVEAVTLGDFQWLMLEAAKKIDADKKDFHRLEI